MNTKIKWGIIGLGNIADTFAQDLQLIENAVITAVASRNIEKAKAFAETYSTQFAFGSYDELFNCDEVDIVYIATPHTSHKEYSIAAMNKGKHVLCEKPAGINKNEVEQIINVSKKNKVFFMEALWSRFNPTIVKTKEIISSNKLGELKYINADFAFNALDRDEKGRLLNQNLGGGSILDVGIYPIFLAYLFLGNPDSVSAKSNFYKTGVEIQTSIIFNYKNAQAILYSGLNSNSEMKAELHGEKGSIYIDPRWHESDGYSILQNNKTNHFSEPKKGKGYVHEINEVNKCLSNGKLESDLWSHQNSLDLVTLLDMVRNAAGVKFPFE